MSKKEPSPKRGTDDVFDEDLALHWAGRIGEYGDPIRRAIVNPVIAFVLNHFARHPLAGTSIKPINLVQQAFAKVRTPLELSCKKFSDHADWMTEWHAGTEALKAFPDLKSSVLWDLGCGEGYLGRWFAVQEVKYIGVEPSQPLFREAKQKRTPNAQYYNDTISTFLNKNASVSAKPTLITLIGVLDGLSDPSLALQHIRKSLHQRDLGEVPLLLTTFDADYFVSGLPQKRVQQSKLRWKNREHEILARDCAEWERIFASSDYFVLDQRPVHLNALPGPLIEYVLDLWKDEVADLTDLTDQISPRQGPFYFWILVPRRERLSDGARLAPKRRRLNSNFPGDLLSFDPGEVIEAKGNLGSRLYELIEGSSHFTYANVLPMPFKAGELFGQMEMTQNYFCSRILGQITASEQVLVDRFRFTDMVEPTKQGFVGELLRSLVIHLDTVSFTRLTSSKRLSVEERPSRALPSEKLTPVRNCAAVLLNSCAKKVAGNDFPSDAYRGRLLINLTHDQLQNAVFNDSSTRRNPARLMQTIELFVQRNLIDCFSASLLTKFRANDPMDDSDEARAENDRETHLVASNAEADGIQCNIAEFDEDFLETRHYLHLGLIAARYLKRALGFSQDDFDLRLTAYAISACLGSKTDFRHLMKEIGAQKRVRKLSGDTRVRTVADIKLYLLQQLLKPEHSSPTLDQSLKLFIERLSREFRFYSKDSYEKAFSSFIVVKDVWALLACATDDECMWMSPDVRRSNMSEYVKGREQEHRLLAYFQECIGHLAAECGLSVN